MIIEHSKAFLSFMANKDLDRKASQYADSLLFVMQIKPYQMELVQIVGKAGDKNNLDAIRSWVKSQLCCESEKGEDNLETLRNKLQRCLEDAAD
ncbi:hypothetical protein [Rheinheimera texasensis]|uniref:hypothetical protein n=1 Tax=Rheinheimera texasensis TaxID=306205 RepID=UPI0004E1CE26|nr:hypothetical protein [Rheinheimera texasensis]